MSSATAFYCFGSGFANEGYGGFIGSERFLCQKFLDPELLTFLVQFVYLQICISIIQSSIIERAHLDTYIMLAIYTASFV